MLQVKAIKTDVYSLGDNFSDFLIKNITGVLKEKQILAVTSKVVSLAEGRLVAAKDCDKLQLIKRESEIYLGEANYDCHLTIKEGMLIPSAGIDESNSEQGDYILYPELPFVSARQIHETISKSLGLKEFGVLLTDSHTVPLRRGVMGAALAYHGFSGVTDQRGQKDLFGRELKMTQINVADSLAVAATLLMGEGSECCPLAVLEAPVEFSEKHQENDIKISWQDDIYRPLLQNHCQFSN